MSGSVIVAGARTPIGRLLGGLKDKSAADLGGVAIAGALEKAGVSGDQVDYVIMGQVIQAGAGQNPARTAAVAGGIPMNVPTITINKVCLSGINAIALADQLIRAGEVEIVVAGGMESMTQAPHLLPKSREGFKYGDTTLVDSMAYDALWDQATAQAMGMLTEECNAAADHLTREEQDAFAARSHQRAAEAWKNGVFDDEVVPVTVKARGGDVQVTADEGVRADTTVESLGKLRPAFSKDGTITAGSASQISDGACAVVVMSKAKAEELGLDVARRDRRARPGGRPRLHAPAAARQRHREGLREGRHHRRPTSTWSRSTRPSPPSASPRPARSASPRTWSTSTAAPSRWATRSACPAPGSCCTSPTSSSAAAAASARPRSAAAAARATP